MKTICTVWIICILVSLTYAQEPGRPFYPETAKGASNVPFNYHSLRWQNPGSTIYNEIYISFDSSLVTNLDSSALYVSGYPSTVYDSILVNQLTYYPTRYFWCVVEYNTVGFTKGDTWYYTTTSSDLDYVKADDFSFGLGRWAIGGSTTCKWQTGEEINYTLPDPATGKVLAANASDCGGMIISTATFETAENLEFMSFAWLEFDSDWFTDNAVNYATVEKSTDGGVTWTIIWAKSGVSDRNTHISLNLFSENGLNDTVYTVKVRFSTLQNGSNSWWAIDNVAILASLGILTPVHPYITYAEVMYVNQPKAIIHWQQILPVVEEIIQRKEGIPLSNNPYQTINSLQTSYNNTYIDSTINDSTIYTYRIGIPEGYDLYAYSREATVYVFPPVPVELVSFSGSIINGSAFLNWITATELNNRGFEIERKEIENRNKPAGSAVPPEISEMEWKKIGFVNGDGTTNEVNSYSFTDKNLTMGTYQYRLKQIDYDGTLKYSNVIEVTINTPEEFSLEQNYPNPFNPSTRISFTLPVDSKVILKVYNILGREVITLINKDITSGYHERDFDASQIPSGVYLYRVSADGINGENYISTKKMVYIK